jgi:hypothetical protein
LQVKIYLLDDRYIPLRTKGIRVSIIEPAYTKTQFEASSLNADSKVDEYREVRSAVSRRITALLEAGDAPAVVAETVLRAARAEHPKLRYTAGALASRLSLLRRFAPAGMMDAGIRKDLQLDAITVSLPLSAALEK